MPLGHHVRLDAAHNHPLAECMCCRISTTGNKELRPGQCCIAIISKTFGPVLHRALIGPHYQLVRLLYEQQECSARSRRLHPGRPCTHSRLLWAGNPEVWDRVSNRYYQLTLRLFEQAAHAACVLGVLAQQVTIDAAPRSDALWPITGQKQGYFGSREAPRVTASIRTSRS